MKKAANPHRSKQSQQARTLTVQSAFYGYRNEYPVIRIAGKYLLKFGFEIGHQVSITLMPGEIRITTGT